MSFSYFFLFFVKIHGTCLKKYGPKLWTDREWIRERLQNVRLKRSVKNWRYFKRQSQNFAKLFGPGTVHSFLQQYLLWSSIFYHYTCHFSQLEGHRLTCSQSTLIKVTWYDSHP